jgi:hypothetical protein
MSRLGSETDRVNRTIWLLIIAGTLVRVALAFRFDGMILGDLRLFVKAAEVFRADPLHFYTVDNAAFPPPGGWPYPPGFLPWTLVARYLSRHVVGAYTGWWKVPMILADGCIAWVVQDHLRRIGQGPRARIASVILVALGPTFIVISAYHGHLDSLAFLPAVVAVVLWSRPETRNPWLCGALIGAGATIKIIPILMLLALLPTASSWRDRAILMGTAAGILGVVLFPFAIVDPIGVTAITRYQSVPGFGGLSLLVQLDLARNYLHVGAPAVASALGAGLLLKKAPPTVAAVLIILALYVFGGGFFFQYLIWGLPFFLLAGHRRAVTALMILAAVPEAIVYFEIQSDLAVHVFQAFMIVMYFGFVVAFLAVGRRAVVADTVQHTALPMPRPQPGTSRS